MSDPETIARLTAERDALASDRDGYVQLLTDENNRLTARVKELEKTLKEGGAAVERLAFEMPPPNVWTPQFVALGQAIARAARPTNPERTE